MPLYFAYGANMDVAAMVMRCPGAEALGPARLARHRWLIAHGGFATVVRDARAQTPGVLWRVRPAHITALDRYEEVGRGLYRKLVQPVIAAQGPRRALIYIAGDSEPGACSAQYGEAVLAAARHWCLPPAHIAWMERCIGSGAQRTGKA